VLILTSINTHSVVIGMSAGETILHSQ
jgi:hypothetical protein